jgi:hypothetical protein
MRGLSARTWADRADLPQDARAQITPIWRGATDRAGQPTGEQNEHLFCFQSQGGRPLLSRRGHYRLVRDRVEDALRAPLRGRAADRVGQARVSASSPTDRSPRWHSSTISALNSGVNERRRRGFFPMLSMIGHPSG